jgi:hypothetical protein
MKEWLIALVPLAGIAIGAWLTYLFTSRSSREDSIVRFKEEKYAQLLIKLQGFVGSTATPQLKREFFEEQYQCWLYASDDVVLALNAMVHLVVANKGAHPDPQAGRQAVGNIVLAMRKDLLHTTKLDYTAFRYTDVLKDK